MTTQPYRPTGVRFGAAYYLEYQPTDDPTRDLDLMQAAHFTVIRVRCTSAAARAPALELRRMAVQLA